MSLKVVEQYSGETVARATNPPKCLFRCPVRW